MHRPNIWSMFDDVFGPIKVQKQKKKYNLYFCQHFNGLFIYIDIYVDYC